MSTVHVLLGWGSFVHAAIAGDNRRREKVSSQAVVSRDPRFPIVSESYPVDSVISPKMFQLFPYCEVIVSMGISEAG